MTHKISYIIGFRAANEERITALFFVLKKLRVYFPDMEIMIVEQDKRPKLKIDNSLKVKHIFFKNSGLYNRSLAFNIGVRNTTKEVFVFGDADIFLDKKDYLSIFNATETFEAVTSTKIEITNISLTGKSIPEFEVLSKRTMLTLGSGFTFAGGILVLTRLGYEKIGGWDDRFEGWGAEDNALSHIIFNKLTSKTFRFPTYHIDHPRTIVDGKGQKKYQDNKDLSNKIKALAGAALERYIESSKKRSQLLLKYYKTYDQTISPFRENWKERFWNTILNLRKSYINFNQNIPTSRNSRDSLGMEKVITAQDDDCRPLKFIFAITTYNRVFNLKKCIDSFFNTKNPNINWQLIIADDGSTDETQEYLEELRTKHGAIIIQNNRVGINRQGNTILKTLSEIDFDLCFKCDEDVVFLREGWEEIYWNAIKETGYDHLIYCNKKREPTPNLTKEIKHGNLNSNCTIDNLRDGLYTITPNLIRKVGYFDEQQFGRRAMAQIDFSYRCCRAGFNLMTNPFDVVGSNDFIQLSRREEYSGVISPEEELLLNSKSEINFSNHLLRLDRTYIPYNENFYTFNPKNAVS